MSNFENFNVNQIFMDVSDIIDSARLRFSKVANSEITLMFWNVGKRINSDVLDNPRAQYGKEIVAT